MDFFETRFEDFYSNPDFVAIIFALLVFIFAFTSLQKFVFKENKSVNLVIALCISLMFLISFRDLTGWIAGFSLVMTAVAVGLAIAIGIAFYKFAKKNFNK